jgi:signal transduction histidine kinase
MNPMDNFSQELLAATAATLKLTSFSILRLAEGQKTEVVIFGGLPGSQSDRLESIKFPPLHTQVRDNGSLRRIQLIITESRHFVYLLLGFRDAPISPFSRRPDLESLTRLTVPCLQFEINRLNVSTTFLLDEIQLVSSSTKALLNGFKIGTEQDPFEITLEQLLRLFSLEHGSIWELHDNEYLTLEALVNCDVLKFDKNCLPKQHGLVWRVLASNAPKIMECHDLKADDLENRVLYDIYKDRPVYLVRLGEGVHTYGVACLVGRHGTSIKSSDYSYIILETFEQFLALELQSRRKDYSHSIFFTSVPKLLRHDKYTVAEICNTACEDVIRIMNCQAASIFLKPHLNVEATNVEICASRIKDGETPSEQYEKFKCGLSQKDLFRYLVNKESLTGTVAFSEQSLICNEVSKHKKNSFTYREIHGRPNDTWIGVPIMSTANRCLGVLRCTGKLTHTGKHRLNYVFDSLDSQLLTNLASIIAPLIQHIQSARDLEEVNEHLANSERLKEHEMRGPLQLISSNSEFVNEHLDDPSVTTKAQRLQDILTNVELCDMLLTSAKLPSVADFHRQLQPVLLRNKMKVLVDALRHQIEGRSPSQIIENTETGLFEMRVQPYVIIELTGSCSPIRANPYLLQRAFYNIANNAIKYAKWNEKGRLKIHIKDDPMTDNVLIMFEDNGIGIDKDETELIFGRRFRGKGTSDRPGQGIGLKIAKAIIEIHGGVLRLTNERDPTRFEITLPISPKIS